MKFTYNGPLSGVTLKEKGAKPEDAPKTREVMLQPGSQVDLPETHEYVKTLVKLGHLTPAPPAPAPTKADSAVTKEASK